MKNIDFEIGEYGVFPEEDSHNSYKVVGLDLPYGLEIDDLTINDDPLWVKLDGAKYPEDKELWSDRQKAVALENEDEVINMGRSTQRYTSQLQMLVRVVGVDLAIKLLNDAIAKEKAIE